MKILCQAEHINGGCYTCGGYGYIMEKLPVCERCKVEGWTRPGAWTCYDGKPWRTVDGLEMTWHPGGSLCAQCESEIKP